jgi:drug/metabolite transporter superfamily protein YnfA
MRIEGEEMRIVLTIAILIGAAVLESGGDALIRLGLHGLRFWMVVGGLALAAYGIVVNLGTLDFGRLMGVYIVIFFIVSQVIAAAVFHQSPMRGTMIGGALIVVGGAVMMVM